MKGRYSMRPTSKIDLVSAAATLRSQAARTVAQIEKRGGSIYYDPAEDTVWVTPFTCLTVELDRNLERYTAPIRDYLVERRREVGLLT